MREESKIKNKVLNFFDDRSAEYDKKFVDPIFWRFFNEKYFLTWVSNLDDKKLILDLGCGTGRAIPILSSKNAKIIGADMSKRMLKIAKSKTRKSNVRFVLADLEQLPFKNNISDAIVCYGVLQYLPNPSNAIKEISRILKTSGSFFGFETHKSVFRPLYEKLSFLRGWTTPYHTAFSVTQLTNWFKENRINASCKVALVIPPKVIDILYKINKKLGLFILLSSENSLDHIPFFNKLGGGIIITGIKVN